MSKWWFSGVISRSGGCVAHGFAGLEADVLVDLDPVAQLGGHGVDSELEALKRERQLAAPAKPAPPPPYLPKELAAGSASVSTSQGIGDKAKA